MSTLSGAEAPIWARIQFERWHLALNQQPIAVESMHSDGMLCRKGGFDLACYAGLGKAIAGNCLTGLETGCRNKDALLAVLRGICNEQDGLSPSAEQIVLKLAALLTLRHCGLRRADFFPRQGAKPRLLP
ncbi:hypothetical protein NKH14_16035 [Mesorhizobium sp. M1380]|uniref:hypothetical protein n=1 Tax=Mesorhizobium sp. M1380 TaxID=2957093 RepID=UPI003337C63E